MIPAIPCGIKKHRIYPFFQPTSSGSANRTARHVEKSSIETPSVSLASGLSGEHGRAAGNLERTCREIDQGIQRTSAAFGRGLKSMRIEMEV